MNTMLDSSFFTKHKILLSTTAVVLALQPLILESAENELPDCLFGSFSKAGAAAVVQPCGTDEKGVGKNPNVLRVMQRFNITIDEVKFQECPGGEYLAMPSTGNSEKFIIHYPKETSNDLVAPITHELAHVFQMRLAGGLQKMRESDSPKLVELGADFLSGLIYSQSLKHLPGGSFENSLALVGSYDEKKKSHGLPNHRVQAFRRGVTGKYPYDEINLSESWKYFRENDYAKIR